MKTYLPGVTAILIPLFALGAAPRSAPAEVALAGQFLGDGPFPVDGTTWFVLVPGGQFELIETPVRVETRSEPDACAGSVTRVVATKVQSSQKIRDPMLMVRGSSAFKAGPVDTVFSGHRYLYPGENVSFRLKEGAWLNLTAYGSAMPDSAVTNYSIQVSGGPIKQTIAEFPIIDTDGPPQLLWAGDLDRDEKPDMLFDLTTSYAGRLYVLFLSSQAGDGRLVREIGRVQVNGC